MKLTEKQKRFADYYIETADPTASYKRAYGLTNAESACTNAHRLLRNDRVRSYIDQIMSKKDKELIASQNEVLQKLTRIMRGEEYEEVVVTYRNSYDIVKKQVSTKEQLKAAELIGKRYALFTERIENSGEVGIRIEIDYGDEIADESELCFRELDEEEI
jgi:phage terminase small subunit